MSDKHLIVLPPDPAEMVPDGWWRETLLPAVMEQTDPDAVDRIEGMLNAKAKLAESIGMDSIEFLKGLWVLDYWRGLKLPEAKTGRPKNDNTRVIVSRSENVRLHRLRSMVRHWKPLLFPHLLQATAKATCSKRFAYRLIAEHTPAEETGEDSEAEAMTLWAGDFRERCAEIPDGSVDLIVTDPPYERDTLPLWNDLSLMAARVLAQRGILFAWTGQIYLPEVMNRLSDSLNYGWTFALQLPGSGSRIMGRHIIQAWKPVLAYTKGKWPSGKWGDDWLISPKREKDHYVWQQNAAPAQRLIERYCPPGGVVLDPFLGVGSFGLAAKNAERRFIGVELNGPRMAKSKALLL